MDFEFEIHWDGDGNPITFDEWVELFEDDEACVLKQDFIGTRLISTVWLGVDHSTGLTDKPLIYQTAVFRFDAEGFDPVPVDQKLHETKEDAVNWHERWVAQAEALMAAGMEGD